MRAVITPSYCDERPSAQTAVDIFKGKWWSAFPSELNVAAGTVARFETDTRVRWVDSVFPLTGKSIVELGPFEAYNTYELVRLGASVIAVEGNDENFMKCLIVKELLKFDAEFLYGDMTLYLEQANRSFDVCWASGVLYHHDDPVRLLDAITKTGMAVFVSTHYFDEQVFQPSHKAAHFFDSSADIKRELGGVQYRYHYKNYLIENPGMAAGGPKSYSFWMERDQILSFFSDRGYDTTIMIDDKNNPNGPGLNFLAKCRR